MDWARAIEINQAALTRIVAALIAMVGLTAQGALARLPRPLYRAALRVLRPAESAVRRLIVIAARGIVVKPRAVRPMPEGLKLARVAAPVGRFSCSTRGSVSICGRDARVPRSCPASSSSSPIPTSRRCSSRSRRSVPRRSPMMAWSGPSVSAAVSRRSRRRSKTWAPKSNVWPAGKQGARGWPVPSSVRRSAKARRPAIARSPRRMSTGS